MKILIALLALAISASAQEQAWMRSHAKKIAKAQKEVRQANADLSKAYADARDDCSRQLPGGTITSNPEVFTELKCVVKALPPPAPEPKK